MGKNNATEEDNHIWQDVMLHAATCAVFAGANEYDRLILLLKTLEIPEKDFPTEKQLEHLRYQLQNLRSNFLHWFKKDQTILKKHLAFTLLVPGGKADRARGAVNAICHKGWLGIPPGVGVRRIAALIKPYVRFHNVKAKRLVDTLTRKFFRLVETVHLNPDRIQVIHDYILKNIKGLGRKATAHFMRNTGLCMDKFAYPIIDVHIHKVLEKLKFKHATYNEAEQSFWTLVKVVGMDVILLDAALWCIYSRNWNFTNSDFDNFGYNNINRNSDRRQ